MLISPNNWFKYIDIRSICVLEFNNNLDKESTNLKYDRSQRPDNAKDHKNLICFNIKTASIRFWNQFTT